MCKFRPNGHHSITALISKMRNRIKKQFRVPYYKSRPQNPALYTSESGKLHSLMTIEIKKWPNRDLNRGPLTAPRYMPSALPIELPKLGFDQTRLCFTFWCLNLCYSTCIHNLTYVLKWGSGVLICDKVPKLSFYAIPHFVDNRCNTNEFLSIIKPHALQLPPRTAHM